MAFSREVRAFLVGGFAVPRMSCGACAARSATRCSCDDCALCGLGLLTMVSVNDPLRDRLLFEPFAVGVALGCVALTAASQVDFPRLERTASRSCSWGGALGCRCCCSSSARARGAAASR